MLRLYWMAERPRLEQQFRLVQRVTALRDEKRAELPPNTYFNKPSTRLYGGAPNKEVRIQVNGATWEFVYRRTRRYKTSPLIHKYKLHCHVTNFVGTSVRSLDLDYMEGVVQVLQIYYDLSQAVVKNMNELVASKGLVPLYAETW